MGLGTTQLLLSDILIGNGLHNFRASDKQVGGVLKSDFHTVRLKSPELLRTSLNQDHKEEVTGPDGRNRLGFKMSTG